MKYIIALLLLAACTTPEPQEKILSECFCGRITSTTYNPNKIIYIDSKPIVHSIIGCGYLEVSPLIDPKE